MSPEAAMLFAAGFGTRMGDLTRDRPKPLIEVAGRPLIDHTLDLLRPLDLPRLVANLHYKPEMLRAHLEPQGIALSLEEPDILDTGGGLRAALPLLGTGPVFTVNTDAIWSGPNPLEMLRAAWDAEAMDALLICVPSARVIGHKGAGDFDIDETGRLSRGTQTVYAGVQIMRTELLAEIEEHVFSLNRVWDRMLQRNRLFALEYPGRWCDVGHPEGIALAERLLAEAPDV